MATVLKGSIRYYLLAVLVGITESVVDGDTRDETWVTDPGVEANWTEAEIACQAKNGYLFHETSSINVDSLEGKLEPDTQYWVGGRVVSKSWTWDSTGERLYTNIGYAPTNLVEEQATLTQSRWNNQVFTCFVHCSTHYVAVQKTKCVCLKNKPNPTSNTTAECVRCPGNNDEHCGNRTGYNIYYDPLSSTGKFREVRKNTYLFIWAYLEVHRDQKVTVGSSNTSDDRRGFLCSSPQRTGQSLSRSEAVLQCVKRGESLLQVTRNTNLRSLPVGEYWIGLTRNYTWQWLNGKPLNRPPRTSPTYGQCIGVVKNNGVRTSTGRCSDKKRYICYIRPNTRLGEPQTPPGDTTSKTGSSPDWKVWVTVGVVGGVLVIGLVVAVGALLRHRKIHGGNERGAESGKSTLAPIIIEPSIMESEYSDVRDFIIGATTPPPDIVTDEGLYSEPCRESGNFTFKKRPRSGLGASGDGSLRKNPDEDDQRVGLQYDIPQNQVNSEGPVYSTPPQQVKVCEEVEYGVPGLSARSDSLHTPRSAVQAQDLGYDIPRSASFADRTTITKDDGKSSPRSKKNPTVNPKLSTKWEPGRYDVPRSNENVNLSNNSMAGSQTLSSNNYDTTASQIYSVPKK